MTANTENNPFHPNDFANTLVNIPPTILATANAEYKRPKKN